MKKRKILIEAGRGLVPLGKNAKGGFAIIDIDDIKRVGLHNWCFDGRYAATDINKKKTRLHVFIMSPKKGLEIDHVNGDGLDNRRSNLRHLSHADNIRNRHNAKGYYYDKRRGTWDAKVGINNKTVWLGSFDSKDKAIQAYNRAVADSIGNSCAS